MLVLMLVLAAVSPAKGFKDRGRSCLLLALRVGSEGLAFASLLAVTLLCMLSWSINMDLSSLLTMLIHCVARLSLLPIPGSHICLRLTTSFKKPSISV